MSRRHAARAVSVREPEHRPVLALSVPLIAASSLAIAASLGIAVVVLTSSAFPAHASSHIIVACGQDTTMNTVTEHYGRGQVACSEGWLLAQGQVVLSVTSAVQPLSVPPMPWLAVPTRMAGPS